MDRVDEERRRALDAVLSRLTPEDRRAAVSALGRFADAARAGDKSSMVVLRND
ncbi:hypothetical protein [Amycolatopsis sp. NPDC051372]|uniref:hypothetical protein n=1 Tax=Amycolatopsis sp. NPDC051372 TaxID=3155669 RepID=UPI0034485DBE